MIANIVAGNADPLDHASAPIRALAALEASMKLLSVSCTAFGILIWSPAGAADQVHRICITEHSERCDPSWQTDAYAACHTTLDLMEREICTIHAPGAQDTTYQSSARPLLLRSGEQGTLGCGYTVMEMTCHALPDDIRVEGTPTIAKLGRPESVRAKHVAGLNAACLVTR